MSNADVNLIIRASDKASPALDRIERNVQNVQAGMVEFDKAVKNVGGGSREASAQIGGLLGQFRSGTAAAIANIDAVMDKTARTFDKTAESVRHARGEVGRISEEVAGIRKLKAQADANAEALRGQAQAAEAARQKTLKSLEDEKRATDAKIRDVSRLAKEEASSRAEAERGERDADRHRADRAKAQDELDKRRARTAELEARRAEERSRISGRKKTPENDAARSRVKELDSEIKQNRALERAALTRVERISRAEAVAADRVRSAAPRGSAAKDLDDLKTRRTAIIAETEAAKKRTAEEDKYARARKDADEIERRLRGKTGVMEAADRRVSKLTAQQERYNEALLKGAQYKERLEQVGRLGAADVARMAQSVPADVARYRSGFSRVAAGAVGSPGLKDAGRDARTANREMGDLRDTVGGLTHKFLGLATAYTLFHGAINQFGEVVDVFRKLQMFDSRMRFANAGDAEKTARDLDYVRAAAEKYGIALSSLLDDYSKFAVAAQASGLSAKNTKVIFDGLLSAARVNKLSDDNISRATYALQQMVSKGKVSAEELRLQLGEALPGAVTMFAKSLGYTTENMSEFYKALEQGQIMSDKAVPAFGEYLKNEYAPALAAAADSFEANLARFRNSIFEAREAFAKSGFMDGLEDTLRGMTSFFRSDDGRIYFRRLGEAAGVFMRAIGEISKFLPEIVTAMGVIAGTWMLNRAGKNAANIRTEFVSRRADARDAALAMGAAGEARSLTRASAALTGLKAAGGALLTVLGGIPGIAIAAAASIYTIWSNRRARQIEETNSRIETTRSLIRNIRLEAAEAGGDFAEMGESLQKVIDMSDAQRKVMQRGAMDGMTQARQQMSDIMRRMTNSADPSSLNPLNWIIDQKRQPNLDAIRPQISRLIFDLSTGKKTAGEFSKAMDDLASANVGLLDPQYVADLQVAGHAYEQQRRIAGDTLDVLEAANGTVEDRIALQKRLASDEKSSMEAQEKAHARQSAAVKEIGEQIREMASDGSALKNALDFTDAMKANHIAADNLWEKLKDVFDPTQYAILSAQIAQAVNDNLNKITADFMNPILERLGVAMTLTPEGVAAISGGIVTDFGGAIPQGSGAGGEVSIDDKGRTVAIDPVLKGLSDIEVALLNAIAARESGGAYNVRYTPSGAKTFVENGRHPGIPERTKDGRTSTAAGRYQFVKSTWDSRTGGAEFTRENQDREALRYAKEVYRRKTGRDLIEDLGRNGMSDGVMENLSGTWEAFTSKEARAASRSAFNATIQRRAGISGTDVLGIRGGDGSLTPATSWTPSDAQVRALGALGPVLKELPDAFQRIVQPALLTLPENRLSDLSRDDGFLREIRTGDAEKIANALNSAGLGDVAESLRKMVAGEFAGQETTRRLDAQDAYRDEIKGLPGAFGSDDLLDADKLRAAVNREAEKIVSTILESGATLAEATGAASERAARDMIELKATEAAAGERQKQLAEKSEKDAKDRASFDEKTRNDMIKAEEEARIEAMPKGYERDLAKATLEVDHMERAAGLKLEEETRRRLIAAKLAEYQVDTKKAQQDEEDKNRKERVAELEAQISAIQERIAHLRNRLQWALDAGDVNGANVLRDQIREQEAALRDAQAAAEGYLRTLSGPEHDRAAEAIARNRAETERNALSNEEYRSTLQGTADMIQGPMENAFSSWTQSIANGENVWKSLASALKSAVGQMLIDLGMLIFRAAATKMIMSALGLAMPQGGGAASIMGSLLGGQLPGVGQHHDGREIGDHSVTRNLFDAMTGGLRSNERIVITEVGEEVLTRKDPRHRRNLVLPRYHSGGEIGLGADDVRSGMRGIQSSASFLGEMNKKAAERADPVVNVNSINVLDPVDILNEALRRPGGSDVILNWMTANRRKVKGI